MHSLGNAQTQESVNFLKEVILKSGYVWVVYGAIRSLTEIALFKFEEEGERLLFEIFEIFESQTFDFLIVNEFRSCLETPLPSNKIGRVIKVIDKVIESKSKNFIEKKVWEKLKTKILDSHDNK